MGQEPQIFFAIEIEKPIYRKICLSLKKKVLLASFSSFSLDMPLPRPKYSNISGLFSFFLRGVLGFIFIFIFGVCGIVQLPGRTESPGE